MQISTVYSASPTGTMDNYAAKQLFVFAKHTFTN